jgi:hypothetical protein
MRKLHRWRSIDYVEWMIRPIHWSTSTNTTFRDSLIWEHFYVASQVRGCHLVIKETVCNSRPWLPCNKGIEPLWHFKIVKNSLVQCLYFGRNQFIIWFTSNVIWLAFWCINFGKLCMNYCKYNKVAVERTIVHKTTNYNIITKLTLSLCRLWRHIAHWMQYWHNSKIAIWS